MELRKNMYNIIQMGEHSFIEDYIIGKDMEEWSVDDNLISRPRLQLGSGKFGRVFEATYNNTVVALKVMKHAIDPIFFYNEIRMLNMINNDHIPKFYGYVHTDRKMAILMEKVKGISLFDFINISDIGLKQMLCIIHQLAVTLQYLHTNNILYRDIKPDNIMIDPISLRAYFVDFGLACHLSSKRELVAGLCGTPGYIAPEVLEGRHYGLPSDIFSFGATMYVIFTRADPTHPKRMERTLSNMVNPPTRSMIVQCISWDPQERPSAAAIVFRIIELMDTEEDTKLFSSFSCFWKNMWLCRPSKTTH